MTNTSEKAIAILKSIPIDEDTKITKASIITIDLYTVSHQYWIWDSIRAESIIFIKEDVINITKEKIIELVKQSEGVKVESEITFSDKSDKFIFVNFNFKIL